MSPVNTQYASAVAALSTFNTAQKVSDASWDKLFEAAKVNPDTFLNFAKGAIIVGYVRMMLGDKNNAH